MSTKLNRDAILREMLSTLIRGWGRKAVYDTLDEIVEFTTESTQNPKNKESHDNDTTAVHLIEAMPITGDRRELMIQFARDFDAGKAFPKISDVRAFLASHHRSTGELRTRNQALRMIVPLLEEMSEKGLLKVISRSQHSGPAELGSISDAIKDAGENLRRCDPDDDTPNS